LLSVYELENKNLAHQTIDGSKLKVHRLRNIKFYVSMQIFINILSKNLHKDDKLIFEAILNNSMTIFIKNKFCIL
jgi:hypothetical protein